VPKNARKSPENRSSPWQCFRILASLTRWHCVRNVRSGRELWGEWNHDETIVRGLVCGVSHPGRRRCGRCSAAGLTPGSETRRERTLTVTIEAIDPKVPSVRVKGPQGRVLTMAVSDPKQLQTLEPGDTVDLTYYESLLVKVGRPARK
jgi:hypothetical protein